ncbi:MAG: chromosome segregation protein SMC [Methylobacter sp.]|nr:MAG: chromosome segregation protein SMC [Methylobacter sp.]
MLLHEITLTNLLSFEKTTLELKQLNVLIGHNGSGKSNLIEAIGLIQSTPSGITGPIRESGGIRDWIWQGTAANNIAGFETVVSALTSNMPNIRYKIEFAAINQRFEILDECIENETPIGKSRDPYRFFYYRNGIPYINFKKDKQNHNKANGGTERQLQREDIDSEKSILAQRRDPDHYPELTYLADTFAKIRIYRDWSFGRHTAPRLPQKTDLPSDFLLENCQNLGLVLNKLSNIPSAKSAIVDALNALYPSITDFGVNIEGGTVQVFLHEGRFSMPATRLSDGTLRYLCLLAILCHPNPPPLICIEEPELGLHPDALNKLADLMKSASERTQLIVTTHSDLLVDAFTDRPDDVVIFEKDGETSNAKRLDAAELETWLEKYTLGQMRQSGHIGGNRW